MADSPVRDERTSLLPFLNAMRIAYIDNLRTFLTAMLIVQHAAFGYSGYVPWPYTATPSTPVFLSTAVDQTFLWGMFFFVSGYSSSLSAQTKSAKQFVTGKLIRLGIPALLYPFLMAVVIFLVTYTSGKYFLYYRSVSRVTEYLVALLCLDLIYIVFRSSDVASPFPAITSQSQYDATAWGVVLTLIAINYLLRSGSFWWGISPQGLDLPLEYIIAYVTGLNYAQLQPYILVSYPPGPFILFVGGYILAAVSLYVADFQIFGGWISPTLGHSLDIAFYAIWWELCFYFLSRFLLSTFESSEVTRKRWGTIGRYQYAALLIHPLPVLFFQRMLHGWHWNGIVATLIVGSISVLSSWALAWGMLWIPGLASIL